MIEERDDATQEKTANQEKIQQLMQSLKDGSSFEEMTNSQMTKAQLKTEVNYLGLGRSNGARVRKYSFQLIIPGDISKPIQTMYGWHVIKLLTKRYPVI